MYKYDNLHLAVEIAEQVKEVPIVLLHSGGLRVMEAMLLALDKPNIYLEMSFSVPFYANSRVWEDFCFAYRKIGYRRVLYASDYPYVSIKESLDRANQLLDRARFSDFEREAIFYENASNLINLT